MGGAQSGSHGKAQAIRRIGSQKPCSVCLQPCQATPVQAPNHARPRIQPASHPSSQPTKWSKSSAHLLHASIARSPASPRFASIPPLAAAIAAKPCPRDEENTLLSQLPLQLLLLLQLLGAGKLSTLLQTMASCLATHCPARLPLLTLSKLTHFKPGLICRPPLLGQCPDSRFNSSLIPPACRCHLPTDYKFQLGGLLQLQRQRAAEDQDQVQERVKTLPTFVPGDSFWAILGAPLMTATW